MFEVGFGEILMLGLVALLVIGPEDLPKVARMAGLWFGKARRMVAAVKFDIERELRAEEMRELIAQQSRTNPLEELVEESKEALLNPRPPPKSATVTTANKADTTAVSTPPGVTD